MIYQFQFTPKAEEEFAALEKILQKRLITKLTFFEKQKNPLAYAKKMQGTKNRFRFRIGDYRVIIAEKKDGTLIILLILTIGHRKSVYE